MNVKLINNPTLDYTDWAIGECYDKGCYIDPEKKKNRIYRVANVSKHSSVLEFTDYVFEITASPQVLNLKLQSFNNKFILVKKINTKKAIIKFNARTLQEFPLPNFIYEKIPENHKFLIGFEPISGFEYYVVSENSEIYKVEKGNSKDTYTLPYKLNPGMTEDGITLHSEAFSEALNGKLKNT